MDGRWTVLVGCCMGTQAHEVLLSPACLPCISLFLVSLLFHLHFPPHGGVRGVVHPATLYTSCQSSERYLLYFSPPGPPAWSGVRSCSPFSILSAGSPLLLGADGDVKVTNTRAGLTNTTGRMSRGSWGALLYVLNFVLGLWECIRSWYRSSTLCSRCMMATKC
ncbi:hypothetical protein VTI74DRAFT_10976 [Chaetomium olivicolor]